MGPALFFSLLVITVSFLPIFTLEAQEGRLFSPLAFTKTFSMAAAALLSVTLVPALMVVFVRGRIMPEAKNPDQPSADLALPAGHPVRCSKRRLRPFLLALAVLAVTVWPMQPARQRVHAQSQRGHAALHADDPAGPFGHQGGGTAANPGQDHQVLPGGRRPSMARPAAPRPPPIRRRPKCSRPSST